VSDGFHVQHFPHCQTAAETQEVCMTAAFRITFLNEWIVDRLLGSVKVKSVSGLIRLDGHKLALTGLDSVT